MATKAIMATKATKAVCEPFIKMVLKKAGLKELPEPEWLFRKHQGKRMRLMDLCFVRDVDDFRGKGEIVKSIKKFFQDVGFGKNEAHPHNARIYLDGPNGLIVLAVRIVTEGLSNGIELSVVDGCEQFFSRDGRCRCCVLQALYGDDLEVPVSQVVREDDIEDARMEALLRNIDSRTPAKVEGASTRSSYDIHFGASYMDLLRANRRNLYLTRIMDPWILGKEPLSLPEVMDSKRDGDGLLVANVEAMMEAMANFANDVSSNTEEVNERLIGNSCIFLDEFVKQCAYIIRKAQSAMPGNEWQTRTLCNFRHAFTSSAVAEMTKKDYEELDSLVKGGENYLEAKAKIEVKVRARVDNSEKAVMRDVYRYACSNGTLQAAGRLGFLQLYRLDDEYGKKQFVPLADCYVSEEEIRRVARRTATAVMDAYANGGVCATMKCCQQLFAIIPRLVDIPHKWSSFARMMMSAEKVRSAVFGEYSSPDEKAVLAIDGKAKKGNDKPRKVTSIWWK